MVIYGKFERFLYFFILSFFSIYTLQLLEVLKTGLWQNIDRQNIEISVHRKDRKSKRQNNEYDKISSGYLIEKKRKKTSKKYRNLIFASQVYYVHLRNKVDSGHLAYEGVKTFTNSKIHSNNCQKFILYIAGVKISYN